MTVESGVEPDCVTLAAEIVAAFVSKNSVPVAELPGLIASIHAGLIQLAGSDTAAKAEPLTPAGPVRRSVQPDYIVCLEDGKKFKSLKRHLRTRYDLTPDQYRTKWNLSADYPMVAPNYAKARSDLAKQMGLGQGGRQAPKKKTR